jgi:hypothetical protein
LAEVQSSCLPDMVWTYEPTSAAFTESKLMYRTFRAWNFANKHGFKLHSMLYEGTQLSACEIERFNLFIQSGGAMAAANLDHWEAVRLFDKIRFARTPKVRRRGTEITPA